jgi:hypothetical protein
MGDGELTRLLKGTQQRGIFFLPVAILRGSASFWNELEVGSHYGSKGRKQRRIPLSLVGDLSPRRGKKEK